MANLSVTAASVLATASAITAVGVSGATITAGQPLYVDTANGNVLKPAIATTLLASTCAGVALHASLTNQPIAYITGGQFNPGATVAVGVTYVVSATSGAICPMADLVQTNYSSILGIATTTSNISLARQNSGVAIA